MKTLMMIAAFVALASGCATTARDTTVVARGSLGGLVRPEPPATQYTGFERNSRDGR